MNFKFLPIILSCTTILTTLPVSAYELDVNGDSIESVTYQNSEDEDFSNETSVLAEIGSQYKVTIPKFIVLSGKNKTANYKVSVDGDIAGNEIVYVTPDEYVNLYSKNKNMQIGSIDQDKIAWKYDNFDVDANGNIVAKSITAGKWSGIFNFNIELASTPKQYVLSDIILPPLDEDTILPNLSLVSGSSKNIEFDNTDKNELLSITSSDENVVDIEDTKLIAKNPGTATITTEFIDRDITFDVTVTENKSSKIHKHTESIPAIENKIDATCTVNGSYDEVVYCSTCNEELSRITYQQKAFGHNYKETIIKPTCKEQGYTKHICLNCGDAFNDTIIQTSNHKYENGVCIYCGERAKSLSEMSFDEIQEIAKSGEANNYNIKIGDKIKVNNNTEAEVVNIGTDYIEFITVQKVVSATTPYTYATLMDGKQVYSRGPSSFYKYPNVNYNGKYSATICYIGSDIQKEVNKWFNSQSSDFKNVLKETERTYTNATLACDGKNYGAYTKATQTEKEKVYIPKSEEVIEIYKTNSSLKNNLFWTATPVIKNANSDLGPYGSYGWFYYSENGQITTYGRLDCGAVAMFRIG